ncbi:MAG: AEC family transporter [Ruminococcaceae bacterium]|nr:AEC family transporter [Oscillospiraceae bacterium]
MESFEITFINVVIMLLYIVPGYLLCKMKKSKSDHLSSISAVLVYGCTPCLIVSSFLALDFSWQTLAKMGLFFCMTLVLQLVFMGIMWLALRRKFDDARYRVFTVASAMGNVGFFGLPIVRALLPGNPEVMCYSAMYIASMNLIMYTVGVYFLTRDKKFMTPKAAILNPMMLGMAIGLPLLIFGLGAYIPAPFTTGIKLVGDMSAPLCMIILGIRLATVKFKKLFERPFVYLTCLGKMLLFPIFCYAAVFFLPLDFSFKASILILSGTPCASVVFNFSEMYGADPELSANCVLLSTLFCFITLPTLTFLL